MGSANDNGTNNVDELFPTRERPLPEWLADRGRLVEILDVIEPSKFKKSWKRIARAVGCLTNGSDGDLDSLVQAIQARAPTLDKNKIQAELLRVLPDKTAELFFLVGALRDSRQEKMADEIFKKIQVLINGELAEGPSKDEGPVFIEHDFDGSKVNDQIVNVLLDRERSLLTSENMIAEVSDGALVRLNPHNLKERIQKHVRIYSRTGKGRKILEVSLETARTIFHRPRHPFPALKTISKCPLIFTDGRIVDSFGLDPSSGIFVHYLGKLPPIAQRPTSEQVRDAAGKLLALVREFPFSTEADRSVWLAFLLALVARPTIGDYVPLFLFNGNMGGVGKSLLAKLGIAITTGEIIDKGHSYNQDGDEFRKKVFSLLLQKRLVVFFDNLETGSEIGGPELDQFLTNTKFEDRVLSVSRTEEVEINSVFVATGNQIQIARGCETGRRTLPCVIDYLETSNPEERSFATPEGKALLQLAISRRDELLDCCLIILRAGAQRDRLGEELRPWGTFETFSDWICGSIVNAGLPDPQQRRDVIEEIDKGRFEAQAVLSFLHRIAGLEKTVSASDILAAFDDFGHQDDRAYNDDAAAAKEVLVSFGARDPVSMIGKRLKSRIARRVATIDGDAVTLKIEANTNKKSLRFGVQLAKSRTCPEPFELF